MSDGKEPTGRATQRATRDKRLSEALRANLKRRKVAKRQSADNDEDDAERSQSAVAAPRPRPLADR